MKGIVFTELLAMAEQTIGEEVVDDILDSLDLETGGIYTAVGHYPCVEFMRIVCAISDHTGLAGDDLQRKFGEWMHASFVKTYPQFFADKKTALDMLEAIEAEVHVEVRKLYPDAELPRFQTDRVREDHLRMHYRSERPLVPFCHGLVQACTVHFGGAASVACEQVSDREAVFDVRLGQ
jgi:hypothetical protein